MIKARLVGKEFADDTKKGSCLQERLTCFVKYFFRNVTLQDAFSGAENTRCNTDK